MESDLKYYTSKEIHIEYLNLSLEGRNKILYNAIDFMQSHNGRSRFLCIAMAMGYRNDEGLDSYYYKT
jgi:hypothetical protein